MGEGRVDGVVRSGKGNGLNTRVLLYILTAREGNMGN